MSNSLKDQLLGLGFKAPPKAEPAPRNGGGDARRKPEGRSPAPRRSEPDRRPARTGDGRAQERKPLDANERQAAADARRPAADAARRNDRRPPRNEGAPKPRTDGATKPRTREEMDLAKAYAIRAQREKDERIEAERVRQEEARVRREAKAKLAEFLKDRPPLNDPAAEIARHFPYGGKIKRVHVNEAQLKALNAGELGVVQDGGRYLLVDAATLAEVEAIFPAAIALKVDPDAPPGDDPYADPRFQVPDDLVW